ncbi:MAG: glycosyltransferase family 39 protein [Anaerolineaceae bacterium]|nr:glycosyltransferase family 39 protein [Anaerolineaceae bacterium]
MARSLRWFLIALFLLFGFGLRINGLGQMNDATLYDEAAYGLDALSLLDNPQLTPFFERNNGRESLWMYLTAPALAIWGPQPFSLRIMAVFAGMLTLAAAYRLGRELLGKQGALWVMGALAVFYWQVHLSHIGFRAALYPLLAAASLTAFFHAYRTNRRWWLAGLLLGLLFYTYIAARVWVALGLMLLATWLLTAPTRRRGALTALLIALIFMLPLGLYLLNHTVPEDRASQVAISSPDELIHNLVAWAGAWFYQGDAYQTHNLPNRPVFDFPTAIMALMGVIGLWRYVRRLQLALLVIAFAGALAPALLSIDNPHMLRAYGAVVPLTVLLGAGLLWLVRWQPRWGTLVAIALIAWAGLNSYLDFRSVAASWNEFLPGEHKIQLVVDYLSEHPPQVEQTVAVMGFPNAHPVLPFLTYDQADTRWLQFESGYCTVYDSSAPMLAVALSPDINFQQSQLDRFGTLETIHQQGDFTIWQVTLDEDSQSSPTFDFGGIIQLRPLDVLTSAEAGQTVGVTLAFAADGDLAIDYNGFVQLWGTPSPLEGGPLWAQADLRLCEPYPTSQWQSQDVIVQTWELKLPQDISGGSYAIMAGVVDAQTGARLLLDDDRDITPIGEWVISP